MKEKFLKQREELLDTVVARNSRNRKSSVSIQGNQQRLRDWVRHSDPNANGTEEDAHSFPGAINQSANMNDDRRRLAERLDQFELNGSVTADDVQDLLSLCRETLALTGKADRIGTVPIRNTTRKLVDAATDPTLQPPSVLKDRFLRSSNMETVPMFSKYSLEDNRRLIDQPIESASRVRFIETRNVSYPAQPNYPNETGKRQASFDKPKYYALNDFPPKFDMPHYGSAPSSQPHFGNSPGQPRFDTAEPKFEIEHPSINLNSFPAQTRYESARNNFNTLHPVQYPHAPINSTNNVMIHPSPTPQQLNARQSLARELPRFSGDPADWPMFIANFEYTTAACGFTDGENMVRLQKCLCGSALETVRSQLVYPAAVPQVIEELRFRFGRPEVLINSLLNQIRSLPAIRSDKLEGLVEFGLAVKALCGHIEAANELSHLFNPQLIQELVAKLPSEQRMLWAAHRRNLQTVNLRTFSDYMATVARDATSVIVYEPEGKKISSREVTRDKFRSRAFINSHSNDVAGCSENTPRIRELDCGSCGEPGHRLRECETFKDLPIDERWRRVRALNLCQVCLYGHGRRPCRITNRCNIDGCQNRHHALLHSKKVSSDNQQVQHVENHAHRHTNGSTLFRIIPVTVHGAQSVVETYAFLDEGSDLTLVEEGLVKQLEVSGIHQPLCLHWTGNTSRLEQNSMKVDLDISGKSQQKRFKITNARTVSTLNLPRQSFDVKEAVNRYTHLMGLPLTGYRNATPTILIGIDNLQLALPLEIREGNNSGIVAAKTRLGWCVYGNQNRQSGSGFSFHVCNCTKDLELHDIVKQLFAWEEIGVAVGQVLSKEDQRALELLRLFIRRVNDRFVTGLLWISDDVELPDSYPMSLRRLECLERKMERNPELRANLHRQIGEYVAKGYAHRATNEELQQADPRRVWYLPLGAVTNPKKPGKVRLVWDAAAKVNGISLNCVLLKGPDQLSSLHSVLFQFRLFNVAVTSDIKEMFHQVRIREEDKNSQRFLWRSDPTQQPDVYLMDVATFGSKCSPASAQYVKNINAQQHCEQFPKAAKAIIHRHYVDDYLQSFGNEKDAKEVATEVRTIHRKGGFTLHNWRSNSLTVLEHLEELPNATDKHLDLSKEDSTRERVLGMLWNPSSDEMSFATQMNAEVKTLLETEKRPTKRQILRCVMTFFDPLGLLAPFLIHGKLLIQDLWRSGIGWDQVVDEDVHQRWINWTKMIDYIAEIRVPRCYFSGATEKTYHHAQLHAFSDASESAYSCVIYLRTMSNDGSWEIRLVTGKAKVAPLKPVTIPRLELQGCVLAARMMKFVQQNHEIEIKQRYLWTDSSTALSWIRADPHNYRPYVAHRVAEIQELSRGDEWRWVPTKMNPADEATKWGSGPYFKNDSSWFDGPNFLISSEEDWPRSREYFVSTDEEKRATVMVHLHRDPIIEYHRFSRWERLHRTIAYALRFVNIFSKKRHIDTDVLKQHELLAAEQEIIKQVQWESYPDEMTLLRSSKNCGEGSTIQVDSNSQLYQLIPFLDDQGVMRENSRVKSSKTVAYNVRYPVILPRKHRVTELLVDWFHRRFHHANFETVVNEIRQLYSISKLRQVVKKVCNDCQMCKVRNARPSHPIMAPLPAARLADHERPFTFTGLDYFGPLLVKVGRSSVKRWVCLFTCLTTRAVHLEVAFDLSTASCIFCVRRFIGRRGAPLEFYSDNGTNFQGASRILQDQINRGLANTFTNCHTKWTFNPPGAPHMGGVWERLVQSVKCAIKDAYEEGKLNDEGLQTLLVEAEGIVNSRPLTYLPLDAAEYEALTPNHFLLGSSSGVKQPTVPVEEHRRLKTTWDLIQHELDVFWKRWLKEYMPIIRRRSKWFKQVRPIEVGDLVLVVDNKVRNGWIRGRVEEVVTGSDDQVRQVYVRTANGVLRRAVHNLALLDVGRISAVSVDTKMHPGEDVGKQATLP
ncbi:uncharacterized protein LOC129738178 [Uranotaenia lowii]|uniref:uncharacterized protein LOC129738178 n=1 Tax=Uranotaenia lowii TaxID=190385 RepID=UPI00247A50E4|nr:uncharacterized protein LOC129738178 [Uranotaenia lowii]